MQKHPWIITLVVAVLAIVVGLRVYDYLTYSPPPPIPAPPHAIAAPAAPPPVQAEEQMRVLVMSLNPKSTPNMLSEFFGDDDALLVIHTSSDPFNHEKDVILADELLLAFFDQSDNGRISPNRPIFSRLELKYFDKDGAPQYMPIKQAGIKTLYIDPQYYSKAALLPENDSAAHPIGTAIMNDSTARLIRSMVVDASILYPQPNLEGK